MGWEWRKARGSGGSFHRANPEPSAITKPGAHALIVSGRWTPGDAVRPALLWGGIPSRAAAHLRTWRIQKATTKAATPTWALEATVDMTEPFLLRQEPLYFAAPKPKGGFWLWPVAGEIIVETNRLRATLGQPEQ